MAAPLPGLSCPACGVGTSPLCSAWSTGSRIPGPEGSARAPERAQLSLVAKTLGFPMRLHFGGIWRNWRTPEQRKVWG